MKYSFLIYSMFFAFVLSSFAQERAPLSISDKLPNLTIRNIVNHTQGVVLTQELIGKAIILDFGTTYCAPCIQTLGKLDSLQKHFPDDLLVFMVTHEPKEKIEKFLNTNAIAKNSSIPIISEDTVLHSLFSHITQPHEIWIDRQGEVKAYTDHHYLTVANVKLLIDNEDLNWPVKWDFPYDYTKPLMRFDNENINTIAKPDTWQSSVITNHMKGIMWRQTTNTDTVNRRVRVSAYNMPIIKMFLTLYGYLWEYDFFPNQVLITDDLLPEHFYHRHQNGARAEWELKNTYCYDMVFPMDLPVYERNAQIRQQLNWYLGLNIELEKMKRQCGVIYVSNKKKVSSFMKKNENKDGILLKSILMGYNSHPDAFPVISDVGEGMEGKLRFDLSELALENLEVLKKELEPYGFGLKVQEREIETLVIRK